MTVSAPLFAAVLLSACGADAGKYPSLAIRDAERVSGTLSPAQPVESPPPQALSSEDEARVASLWRLANAVHDQFRAESADVASVIRASRVEGASDDSRSRAMVALASLTGLHSETVQALAQIDQLEAEAAPAFASTEEIRTAQSAIANILSEQDATLSTFSAELGQ